MAIRGLCIGINDDAGTQNDLRGCANDANNWASSPLLAHGPRGLLGAQPLPMEAAAAAMATLWLSCQAMDLRYVDQPVMVGTTRAIRSPPPPNP